MEECDATSSIDSALHSLAELLARAALRHVRGGGPNTEQAALDCSSQVQNADVSEE